MAVSSLFHALSLGPSNVVVPINGMFIVGGALLGVLVLGEPMSWTKAVGLVAAVVGVVLISLSTSRHGGSCSRSEREQLGISRPWTTLGEETNAILKVKFVKGRRYIIRVRVHYVMSPEGVALLVF